MGCGVWGVGCGEEKSIIVDSGESKIEFSLEHLNLKELESFFLTHPQEGNFSTTSKDRQKLNPRFT